MDAQLQAWIDNARSQVTPSQVDYATHRPTNGELNNLTYLSMKYLIGWGMRAVDLAVILHMTSPMENVNELESKFIPVLADYMWDHLMGEPESPTADDLAVAICVVRDLLYGQPEFERNAVS